MTIDTGSRPARASSLRQERRDWATELRAQGSTWVEIADAFADRYGVNPRVAFRLAHDWSQRDAADQWNHHWPDDPKTFKNFLLLGAMARTNRLRAVSRRPRPAGTALPVRVADLVIDLADHSNLDTAWATSGNLSGLWLSRYSYFSSGRAANLHGEHTIRLHHAGSRLRGTNDPADGESRLTLDLSVSGAIATGTWKTMSSSRNAPPFSTGTPTTN
ncbi:MULTISPECIES: hypothetical protein [unclassified Kribbella]|uniref:hypothetical protein n=1 Tax=unclassified Kribbella TaxID=2644121 RepID=UPI0033D81BDD